MVNSQLKLPPPQFKILTVLLQCKRWARFRPRFENLESQAMAKDKFGFTDTLV